MILGDQTTTENVEDNKTEETKTQETLETKEGETDDPPEPKEGETDDPPAYEPNFKFKYAVDGSKQQEAEIDEFLRGVIKDEETEKKVRDLYEKAYGIDFVKQDRDSLKDQYTKVQEEFTSQTQALQQAGAYVKHKDYDSFFKVMGIDKKDILEYALGIAQYQQMDPAQRQAYDAQINERSRLAQLELQNEQLTQNYQQFAARQREMELDNALMRQDVHGVASSFDQRVGRPGAFRDEVIKRGQLYAYQGHDVPVDQVITELVGIYSTPTVNGATTQQPQMQQGQQQQPKPVIPNVQGKGTSPVKRVPRNLDDIRKLAAEKAAAANV